MKLFFYLLFKVILPWMAIFFHLYVVYIAFKHGVFSGLITLFLPVISEIYWLINLWDVNSTIRIMFFTLLIGGFLSSFFEKD
jgi:hypothetical protein